MTKYLLAALIALAGLSSTLFYRGEANVATLQYDAAKGRADAAEKALGAAERAIRTHRAALVALQQKAKAQDEALEAALVAHPDWTGQPVPGDVLDALRVR